MPSEELTWLDAHDATNRIRRREISAVELVEATLHQLDKVEPAINAFVTVIADDARRAAARADEAVAAAEDVSLLPPLHGVPLSIKDLADTVGVRTTYGSERFASHVPDHDTIAAGRVRATGGILLGKTTTPEFGMLGTTQSMLTGTTNNPWNVEFAAGGSSGGAAAAVAAGVGAIAWGSDGGGSIRVPASMCGVVGLKPSRGRIPNSEAWDTASTDGPIARSVLDVALLFRETLGPDRHDPLSLPSEGIDYFARVSERRDLKGTRVAFAPRPSGGLVAREVESVVSATVAKLEHAGLIVETVELPLPDPVDYFLAFWGPSFAALDRESALPHPAMREVARKMRGAEAYFTANTQTRAEISRVYASIFDDFDFIITPTLPVAPFRHPGAAGGNQEIDGVPVAMPAIDFHRLTESPSHAGLPALTVPAGFSAEGLPIGLQVVGDHLDDVGVLELGALFEQIAPWRGVRPALA